MSKTTDYIQWKAYLAGVSPAELIAAEQDLRNQEMTVRLFEQGRMIVNIEDADYEELEALDDGNL